LTLSHISVLVGDKHSSLIETSQITDAKLLATMVTAPVGPAHSQKLCQAGIVCHCQTA